MSYQLKNNHKQKVTFISITVSIVLLVVVPSSIYGQVFRTYGSDAKVQGATSMSSYTGETDQLKGTINLNADTVYFELPLKTIKTGIKLRDKHMREALEVKKFPKTRFSGQIITGSPQKGETVTSTVKGDYTIHGVTKQIEVTGTVEWKDDQLIVNASFSINITDYGIERPTVMFVSVYDKHEISIDATLNRYD